MENQQLKVNTILYAYYLEDICEDCSNELKDINVELKYEGYSSTRWQKEKIKHCDCCDKYYISIFKIEEFNKKYPGYAIKEKDKEVPLKFDKIDIYALSKKNSHDVCNGKLRTKQFDFVKERVILKDKFDLHHYYVLRKCPECNRFFAKQDETQKIAKLVKVTQKKAEVISKKSLLRKKSFGVYHNELTPNSKLNVVYENTCLNKHDISNMIFKVGVKVNATTRVMKEVAGWYCKTCDMFIITQEMYDSKFPSTKPDCDLYVNYKKSMMGNILEDSIIKDKNNTNNVEKADFLIRTNIIHCINNRHTVEDLTAEIDVIMSNGEIINKKVPAYYCKDCNLYFIYNKDYERIRKSGVPLCSIYEYTKYIKGIDNDINFNQESLLHSFGYNVGTTEDLSDIQRRRILKFIIENGIMDKHKIIWFIDHLIDMRRAITNQRNAIKRWQSDSDYLKNNDINSTKHVTINSIKVVRNVRKLG